MGSLQSLLIVVFFVDMAIMLLVGGRLLFVATRTRRVAEAAIGMSAAAGALGVILGLTSTVVLERDPEAFPIWALGRLLSAVGPAALAIGNWRIYRAEQTWAAAAAAIVCATALAGCAIRTLSGSITPPGDASAGGLLSATASLAAYGWGTFEAFRYHGQLKRRLALGLADPVVTQQFRLWGISGLCALGSTATGFLFTFGLGRSLSDSTVPFVGVQLALFAAAVCLWLAFFPPGFYRRRLASRSSFA